MSKFSEQVPRRNEGFRFLPLFHTADGVLARDYMQGGAIHTTDVCEVFNDTVTYLFYGRPAYKYREGEQATDNISFYPICFIFDFQLEDAIQKIFPFDTGAMHHGMYDDFKHPRIKLTDFELEPDTKRIADVVLHFFGSNEQYLSSKPLTREIDPFNFESETYTRMADRFRPHITDERRVTIEVIADQHIPFKSAKLVGIIVPMQYMDSDFFRSFRGSFDDVKVKTYTIENWTPQLAFALVSQVAREFIKEQSTHE